jgi:hypothetical protein
MVMHRKRCWGVARKTRVELAELLTSMTWTLCTALQTEGGSIWANDATSEDGAGEYAVLRFLGGQWRQVESITASWCSRERLLLYAEQADRGEFDSLNYCYGMVEASRIEFDHRPCRHCA